MRTLCLLLPLTFACGNVAPEPGDGPDAGDPSNTTSNSTVPETSITEGPAELVNTFVASFTLDSDKDGATFECSLDGAAPKPCTSPHRVEVDDGDHILEVAAVLGNEVDATPAMHTWLVDTIAPTGIIVSGPPARDNSVDVELTFKTDNDEPATFTCAVDGAEPAPCTSPFLLEGLNDGDHEVLLYATDAAGNTDRTPAAHRWNLDASSPDTRLDKAPAGPTRSESATFVFSSPGESSPTFACSKDNGAFAPCTSPVSLASLSQGSHTFAVRATDDLGNEDPTPAVATWIVDTIAPNVSVSGPSGLITDSTPTFTFTAGGSPVRTECRVDTRTYSTCSSPYTSPALSDGNHTFEVRAYDAAGNIGYGTRSFQVDATAPTLRLTKVPEKEFWGDEASFSFTVSGAISTRCRLYAKATGATNTWVLCSSPKSYKNLPLNDIVFEAEARDSAGNTRLVRYEFAHYILW